MSRKHSFRGNRRRGTGRRRGSGRTPRKPRRLVEGTLHLLGSGRGEVRTSEGAFAIARHGLREAMHGDEVQVSLVPMHGRNGEYVAYVQSVLHRACTGFVGTYDMADPLGVVTPLDGRLGHDFFVLPEDKSAQRLGVRAHDVVSARIVEYPTRKSAGVVTIERRVGASDELDVGVESVIASYGLPVEFGQAVLEEADELRLDVSNALASGHRRDLRDVACLTVDPADARDFDDAVGIRATDEGGFELDVHIADVTHFVGWDSSLDIEARHRTCSVYLVDRVIPMLPERLCNDLCSLRPNEDRLAMTVRMRLDARGRVQSSEAYPSVIRSRARLCYDDVDRLLEGTLNKDELLCEASDRDAVANMLLQLDRLAQLRLKIRYKRGAIDFESSEAKVVLDDEGHPQGVVVRERTRATSLIEEAMLLANECVATMLAQRDVLTAYRVHEQPSPEDLLACVPALQSLDLLHGDEAARLVEGNPHAVQEVLAAAHGTPGAYLANALLLRAQKRAIYLPHNEGHYALGAKAYCHFTSPIRRYPDVLVHRALKELVGATPVTHATSKLERALPQICQSCSEKERIADAASRDTQKVKMAELYADCVGESFSGIVVGCARFGMFVMLDDTCAEGLLPIRALGDEWVSFDEKTLTLTGTSTGRMWHVGQRVAVRVVGTDVLRGRIDLALAGATRG